MKTSSVTIAGQQFTITAIAGDLAMDASGDVLAHLMAGAARVGVSLEPFFRGVKDEDGRALSAKEIGLAMVAQLDSGTIAAGVGAIACRLSPTEIRRWRELLLSTSTMVAADGRPKSVIKALADNEIKGGSLTVYALLWEAITLSVLPFFDLAGSAPDLSQLGVPSKELIT